MKFEIRDNAIYFIRAGEWGENFGLWEELYSVPGFAFRCGEGDELDAAAGRNGSESLAGRQHSDSGDRGHAV